MNELKACPFCPAELVSYEHKAHHTDEGCILSGQSFPIEKWNSRQPDPRLIEAVREIEEMKRNILKSVYDDIHIPQMLVQGADNCLHILRKNCPELTEREDEGD